MKSRNSRMKNLFFGLFMKLKSLIRLFVLLAINNLIVAQNNSNWGQLDRLKEARFRHAIVILPNGDILVSGGEGGFSNSKKASAEIFDVRTNKWRYTNPMNIPRVGHNLILLKTGKIIAIGGYKERSCELFDPITETWVMTDSIPTLRFGGQTVIELQNKKILITGGYRVNNGLSVHEYLNNCEIYDPDTKKWETVVNLNIPRSEHSAILLNDGRVLISGGISIGGSILNCEIFNPVSNKWSLSSSLNEPRADHASILLKNGNVFVSGGGSKSSAEIFDIISEKWLNVKNMFDGRNGHSIYHLSNSNKLLIFGGSKTQGTVEDTWETYDAINLAPIEKGIFPMKKIYNNNSVQSLNSYIYYIGGEEFDISSGIPAIQFSNSCHVFSLITSIIEKSDHFLSNYNLYQNYPNPFNPTTIISYNLPFMVGKNSVHVTLQVFDVLGNEIAILVDKAEPPGFYSLTFSLKSVQRAPNFSISSGVYYYKLTVGNFTQIKKMILLK